MATRLNNIRRPVGNALRYVRAGIQLLERTVAKKRRRVVLRFSRESAQEVEQPRAPVQLGDSQRNHDTGAENNTNHVTGSPLTLSTNDSIRSTTGTTSSQSSTFDYGGGVYELDLVLSVALYGDKEQNTYDQAEHDEIDSRSQIIERLDSGNSSITSVAMNIYNSLRSTKKQIDNFVKWYRRELERRNLI